LYSGNVYPPAHRARPRRPPAGRGAAAPGGDELDVIEELGVGDPA
jgi:hypothetical protein